MTRQEELDLINDAIARGKLQRVAYSNEPPHPLVFNTRPKTHHAGDAKGKKYREKHYAQQGL